MITFESNTVQVHIAAYDYSINDFKYLVIQRADSKHPYPGVWQVITGTIEHNEKAIDTAIREIKEEIGIQIEREELWILPYVAEFFNPYKDIVQFSPVFGALINIEDKIILSDEHQDYKWVLYEELLELLIIPSHCQATEIFKKYILNNRLNHFYKYRTSTE